MWLPNSVGMVLPITIRMKRRSGCSALHTLMHWSRAAFVAL